MWAAYTPLRFNRVAMSGGPEIIIRFVSGDHGDGVRGPREQVEAPLGRGVAQIEADVTDLPSGEYILVMRLGTGQVLTRPFAPGFPYATCQKSGKRTCVSSVNTRALAVALSAICSVDG